MKKIVLFLFLLQMVATAGGQSVNGVTFHIEDLPQHSQKLFISPSERVAADMLGHYAFNKKTFGDDDKPEYKVVKTSFDGDSLYTNDFNPVCKGLMQAFADHRPVVLSPDMIWLLISQAFGHYVNQNSQKLRSLLVNHEGEKTLTVMSSFVDGADLATEPRTVRWDSIFNDFERQIADNTKDDVAALLTADFTTTGADERIASQITLMEAVESYFDYQVIYMACGIPDVTLLGTPDDWRKVREKAARLGRYGLEWWISELDPVLEQFVRASEGDVDTAFWQDMVMKKTVKKKRPREVRFRSCNIIKDAMTLFDGWFLKFYPFDIDGRTPDSITFGHNMLPEVVKTPFRYVVTDIMGNTLKEYDMELWAGFFGMTVDHNTGSLTPRIGWMVCALQ